MLSKYLAAALIRLGPARSAGAGAEYDQVGQERDCPDCIGHRPLAGLEADRLERL